jgi:hypothetical protein
VSILCQLTRESAPQQRSLLAQARRAGGRAADGRAARGPGGHIRRSLDDEAPAEGALADLENILQGALEDARSVLGVEEGSGEDGA